MDRLEIIFEEINRYIQLKDYISSKVTEFALYIYTNKLIKLVDYKIVKEFTNDLDDHLKILKGMKFEKTGQLDLSEIFDET